HVEQGKDFEVGGACRELPRPSRGPHVAAAIFRPPSGSSPLASGASDTGRSGGAGAEGDRSVGAIDVGRPVVAGAISGGTLGVSADSAAGSSESGRGRTISTFETRFSSASRTMNARLKASMRMPTAGTLPAC